jgi:hypothetical protein
MWRHSEMPDAEHSAGVITGWAGVEWLDTHEPELVGLETVDEHVDCSHRVILDSRRAMPETVCSARDPTLPVMARAAMQARRTRSIQLARIATRWDR